MEVIKGAAARPGFRGFKGERLTPAPRAKRLCPSGKELCSLERRGAMGL